MIEIIGANCVRMQLDAAEVDDPGETGSVVDDDFVCGAPRRKRKRNDPQPVRPIVRRPLLIERLALSAVHESLEHVRSIANAANSALGDREVVPDDVELGKLDVAREIELVRIGDPDLAPVNGKNFSRFFLRHRQGFVRDMILLDG